MNFGHPLCSNFRLLHRKNQIRIIMEHPSGLTAVAQPNAAQFRCVCETRRLLERGVETLRENTGAHDKDALFFLAARSNGIDFVDEEQTRCV
ncbi:hypothetical protein CCGE531_31925 (plasmid) [Rhizobium sp. CCGE531]|nr:hypothetical protein CCGE531_31925 [Rhizobium sp. CCGE531]